MSIYLSRRDVQRLTGRSQRASQRRILDGMGYRYELDGGGWPLVLTQDVVGRYREHQARWSRPDFSALEA